MSGVDFAQPNFYFDTLSLKVLTHFLSEALSRSEKEVGHRPSILSRFSNIHNTKILSSCIAFEKDMNEEPFVIHMFTEEPNLPMRSNII